MTHHKIFPDVYFSYRHPDHQSAKQTLLNRFSADRADREQAWNCNSTRLNISRDDALPIIIPTLQDFGRELNKAAQVVVDHAWLNFYREGSFQEIHNHVGAGCQLALVYFVSYDSDSDGRFYFYDTNTQMVSSDLPALFDGPVGKFGCVVQPKIQEGDVIIFPSYLHHGVSPHTSAHLRVTLSCNLRFRLNK